MARAIRSSEIPVLRDKKKAESDLTKAQRDKVVAKEKHLGRFKNKKFKDLNQAQKDKLLKACAIYLGLLDDDNDD